MKRVERRTQLLDDLRNRRRYWELKEELKIEKGGNDSLSHKHWEEIKVIFHKFMDLLKKQHNNNNNNNAHVLQHSDKLTSKADFFQLFIRSQHNGLT